MSHQLVAETSTGHHTTFTRDRHPGFRGDSNPQSQQASSRRSTPQTARPLTPAKVHIKDNKSKEETRKELNVHYSNEVTADCECQWTLLHLHVTYFSSASRYFLLVCHLPLFCITQPLGSSQVPHFYIARLYTCTGISLYGRHKPIGTVMISSSSFESNFQATSNKNMNAYLQITSYSQQTIVYKSSPLL